MQKQKNIPSNAKTVLIKKELQKMMSKGILNAAGKLPATGEIAEKFGVSYVTAHRALNELEKDGLLERRNGVGTFVKKQKFNKCERIGIPLRIEGNPFIVLCYEEISRIANDMGIQTVLGSGADELGFIEKLKDNGVKHMIRFPGSPFKETAIRSAIKKAGIKAVILNDWWLKSRDFPCVKIDESAATSVLMHHLYQHGHRKVFLFQEVIFENRCDVVNAFQQWHYQHDIEFNDDNFLYTPNGGYRNTVKLIKDKGFTAVITTFDITALRLLKHLKENAPELLESISVVSMEGTTEAIDQKITVVRQDTNELVSTALMMLLRNSYSDINIKKIGFDLILGTSVKDIKEKKNEPT